MFDHASVEIARNEHQAECRSSPGAFLEQPWRSSLPSPKTPLTCFCPENETRVPTETEHGRDRSLGIDMIYHSN